jgi:Tfp pilus assembly protein PilF/TolB-like protein
LKRFHLILFSLAVCAIVTAQNRPLSPAAYEHAGQTVVIFPFENRSQAPGLEWIGESFPELIGQKLSSASGFYVVSRDDRLYAFDRLGIPANLRPTRATMIRIAQEMDADYAIVGGYDYDGQTFSASAQVLDLQRLKLTPAVVEKGLLTNLIEVERGLAWDVLRSVTPNLTMSRNDFVNTSPPIRLDAFENYIRGVTAPTPDEKIDRLTKAVQIDPKYTAALLELGKTYYDAHNYPEAETWLGRIPLNDPLARAAQFYIGLAAFYQADYERATQAFTFVSQQLPLTEVYNNLGVVVGRRGAKDAADYFQRAVNADPSDPDYHFNLAVALYRNAEAGGAARELKETLRLRPSDLEAKSFLNAIGVNGKPGANFRLPLERIKTNYDESSFQQLALEIENASESRLAKTDPHTHAAYHVERGNGLLEQGFSAEAERQFREAVLLDPTNAGAHVGLARVLLQGNDAAGARAEASTAVRLQPSAAAYLVLARLDLEENKTQAAGDDVDNALALEPSNAEALELKKQVTARTTKDP